MNYLLIIIKIKKTFVFFVTNQIYCSGLPNKNEI